MFSLVERCFNEYADALLARHQQLHQQLRPSVVRKLQSTSRGELLSSMSPTACLTRAMPADVASAYMRETREIEQLKSLPWRWRWCAQQLYFFALQVRASMRPQ